MAWFSTPRVITDPPTSAGTIWVAALIAQLAARQAGFWAVMGALLSSQVNFESRFPPPLFSPQP
jgi:hypothetical protein